jgi:hypothetical protein
MEHEIPVPGGGLLRDPALYAYPEFGVFLYRAKRFSLAIRCGSIGQNGVGGHAHNDQLSIELNVDGEDWITDPGTYLYTPIPERRDEYRSVRAHFAPRMGSREPGHMDPGLFRLGEAWALRLLPRRRLHRNAQGYEFLYIGLSRSMRIPFRLWNPAPARAPIPISG